MHQNKPNNKCRFFDSKNVLIKRGHSYGEPVIPDQKGTWSIANGEIYIQDPLITKPAQQFIFRNLQFYNCGNSIIEGVSTDTSIADYGAGPVDVLVEYRIQTLK